MIGAERRIAGFPIDKPRTDIPRGSIDMVDVSFTEISEWYDAGCITRSQYQSIHMTYDKMLELMRKGSCDEV